MDIIIYLMGSLYILGLGWYLSYTCLFEDGKFWKAFIWPLLLIDELLEIRRNGK